MSVAGCLPKDGMSFGSYGVPNHGTSWTALTIYSFFTQDTAYAFSCRLHYKEKTFNE